MHVGLACSGGSNIADDGGSLAEPQMMARLIDNLASDDPAVRMASIAQLSRRCGDSMGYDPSATEIDRQQAIDRWTAWYRQEYPNG